MTGLLEMILSAWIFSLPFTSFFSVQEEAVRISYYLAVSVFTVVLLLTWKRIRLHAADAWYLLWLVFLSVSSITGLHPPVSFLSGDLRGQSVLFFAGLWTVMKVTAALPAHGFRTLSRAVVISASLESLIVLAGVFAGGRFPFPAVLYGRPVGSFGEPNMAAGYLAASIVFSAYTGYRRIWNIPVLGIISAAAIATGSRAGMLATAIALSGVFIQAVGFRKRHTGSPRRVHKFFLNPQVPGIVAVSVLIAVLSVVVRDIGRVRVSSPVENRIVIWKTAVSAISRRPWFGYGAESGGQVFREEFYTLHNIRLLDLTIDRAHNLILDLFIWSGVFGFLAFTAWIFSTGLRLLGSKQTVRAWGLIAWTVFAMFQPPGIVQWVFLGFIAG